MDADAQFWMVICGFIIAFVLAFGIGANDVANSFGTSVGSKVLTLKQACILATIFEILGAILIGAKVSGTIRKGIVDPESFGTTELMLGYVSALVGCCIWLILATILNLPVSGTHSIVGATIGMAIVSRGIGVIKWKEILKIVSSWFISPLLSGIVSLLMFVLIRKFILRAESPLKAGLRFLPIIYTVTIFVNFGGIVESSPPQLGFDKIPYWGKIILVVGFSVLVYLSVWLILVPIMEKKIQRTIALSNQSDLDEKERFNLTLNEDGQDLSKKNIETQVDYVALIMSSRTNNGDWVYPDADNYEKKAKFDSVSETMDKSKISQFNLMTSQHPTDSSLTIHTDVNYKSLMKQRNNRTRLISAPTSALKDMPDIGDVNLTLRGYLHTIHSPAARQQLTQKGQKSGSQTRERSSISNSLGGGSNVLANPSGAGMSLTKIFTQQQSVPLDNQILDNQQLPTTETQGAQEMKRGRFNCVPAKFPNDNNLLQANLAISERSLAKESLYDAEVDENISELPQKQEKKPKVDDFAHSDPPEAAKLFSFLQILTAVFGSFAHGGNDVSNAIGPLIGLYLIYEQGSIVSKADTPEWILFYGGVGISVGLWVLGRRVIKTIGEDLTKITASSGFVIELASALTVLGASLINIPVSTTHCKVGSVVFTGRVRSKESVDWSLFRNIIIAWIVTVPVTGSIAACCQYILVLIFNSSRTQ